MGLYINIFTQQCYVICNFFRVLVVCVIYYADDMLISCIVTMCCSCVYYREQRERERIAQYCPGDTLLKANSAFHLALQQQTVEYNDETLQAQRRFRDVADFSAGPLEDRETVFDINDFQMEGMKTFFEVRMINLIADIRTCFITGPGCLQSFLMNQL